MTTCQGPSCLSVETMKGNQAAAKTRKAPESGTDASSQDFDAAKQSSLTEQAKSVSYYGREMAPRVSPAKNSIPQEAQGRKMLACDPLPVDMAPTIKEAGLLYRAGRNPQGLVSMETRCQSVTNSRERGGQGEFGGTGRAVGATGELELREGSQSLHHSRTSGML